MDDLLNTRAVSFDYKGHGYDTEKIPEIHWYLNILEKKNRYARFWDKWTGVKTADYELHSEVKFRYEGPSGVRGTLKRKVYVHWSEEIYGHTRKEDFWTRWANA